MRPQVVVPRQGPHCPPLSSPCLCPALTVSLDCKCPWACIARSPSGKRCRTPPNLTPFIYMASATRLRRARSESLWNRGPAEERNSPAGAVNSRPGRATSRTRLGWSRSSYGFAFPGASLRSDPADLRWRGRRTVIALSCLPTARLGPLALLPGLIS